MLTQQCQIFLIYFFRIEDSSVATLQSLATFFDRIFCLNHWDLRFGYCDDKLDEIHF
jgi:hypothetical protein